MVDLNKEDNIKHLFKVSLEKFNFLRKDVGQVDIFTHLREIFEIFGLLP